MRKCLFLVSVLFRSYWMEAQDNISSIENLIRDLEQKSVKAIQEGDTNTLKRMWDPGFMVNTPRNDIAENRDAVLQIQKNGLINYKSFTRTIEKIQVQKDVVITMGFEVYVPNDNLPQAGQTLERRFINVWMKKNGQWHKCGRRICQG